MYLRRTQRRSRGGSVGYLQLAHNEWDPVSKQSKVRVLYSFGREDELDRAAIVRLIGSLRRVLEPEAALESEADEGLGFVESRAMGGAWVLDEPERDVVDEDGNVVRSAFRTYGNSKDHRDDLPQVVI